MSESDDRLREALAENTQFKAEKADSLKRESTAWFRNSLKWCERITWIYLTCCVLIAVPTIHVFMESRETKTLITCVLILLVVYETTVLMKLWFAVVGTKLGLLKEVKQLRLEVSQLASASGVVSPSDALSPGLEPMRGTSKLERRTWIVGLAVAAIFASSLASGGYDWMFSSGERLSSDSLVSIAADGTAAAVTKIETTHSSSAPQTSFQFHAPNSWTVRWLDARGREMPYTTTLSGDHTRYDVSLPEDIDPASRIEYTRMEDMLDAATRTDDVWSYTGDTMYGYANNDFTTTVLLPEGVVPVSVEPEPVLEFESNGRLAYRFEGTRRQNEKFEFTVKYRVEAEADE